MGCWGSKASRKKLETQTSQHITTSTPYISKSQEPKKHTEVFGNTQKVTLKQFQFQRNPKKRFSSLEKPKKQEKKEVQQISEKPQPLRSQTKQSSFYQKNIIPNTPKPVQSTTQNIFGVNQPKTIYSQKLEENKQANRNQSPQPIQYYRSTQQLFSQRKANQFIDYPQAPKLEEKKQVDLFSNRNQSLPPQDPQIWGSGTYRIGQQQKNGYQYVGYQSTQVLQQQQIQSINKQALTLQRMERYDQALEKFMQIKELDPDFPNIEQLISSCNKNKRIQEIYEEGQNFFKNGNFRDAQQRFEYIQYSLQYNYKDVSKYLYDCRQELWKKSLSMVRINMNVSQAMDGMQRFSKLLAVSHQVPEKKIVMPQLFNLKPNYNETKLDSIKIYSDCLKPQQCLLRNSSRPFKHLKCQTLAFFHASGQISCEAKCEEYQLKDAYFICSSSSVCKIQLLSDKFKNEIIQDEQWLAKFVEFCLLQGNYSEGQKWNFREKITCGAYLQFLK